jgi:hypothetical protein
LRTGDAVLRFGQGMALSVQELEERDQILTDFRE